jgi:integration host factor subunit beta
MKKSELIDELIERFDHMSVRDVETAVKIMLEHMTESLAMGNRIEIRGFGSFCLHYRAPRTGRNPKTGESVSLGTKYVPHFKPGRELRNSVNNALLSDLL